MNDSNYKAEHSFELATEASENIHEHDDWEAIEDKRERSFNHRMSWAVLIVSLLSLVTGIVSIVIALVH